MVNPQVSLAVVSASVPQLWIQTPTASYAVPLVGHCVWTIGRSRTNVITLSDQWISRKHAVIQLLEAGKFYFTDLGSQNGSSVNGEPVTAPVLLQPGDRITLGKTELEFQGAAPDAATTAVPITTKTVLMVQGVKIQGEIWREVLNSQMINVRWEPSGIDLVALLPQLVATQQPLPTLLLLDLDVYPHIWEFCRWCRSQYPKLQICLTSGSRTDISSSELRWARHQGAVAVFPAFPADNLLLDVSEIASQVKVVLEALGQTPFHQEALFSALMTLQAALPSEEPTSLALEAFTQMPTQDLPPNVSG